jgi:hypothetical protein
MLRLLCVKSVEMRIDKPYIAFTEGQEYKARKGYSKGSNGDPYVEVRVLKAKNDKGESHIVKYMEEDKLDEFFTTHFQEITD